MSRTRLVIAVCLGWFLIALIASAQASIGTALTATSGAARTPAGVLFRNALIFFLPWIPVTLAAIALALRFPVRLRTWYRQLPLHILASVSLGVLANAISIFVFRMSNGALGGVAALARAALVWTTVRLYLAVLIYAAAVGVTQMVQYFRYARSREVELARVEAQLARAQMQALNAQIRPHFLFNTLHAIGQLWRSGRSEDADLMLDHLGALFHRVQGSTSSITIGLSEELAIVNDYLAIEHARYHDRLRTQISADDAVLGWPVPPLILQPIVENAVRHGIAAEAKAGSVRVRAESAGPRLRVVVHDDGPGFDRASAWRGSGLGLRNTHERLAQMYGDAAELRVDSGEGRGTTVTLLIPPPREGLGGD